MSKMILATCGNDLGDGEYCTERLYLNTPRSMAECSQCQRRGNATYARRPRLANAARMHEIADAVASHECWSHEDEAATLLAYAAARIEVLERLESDLASRDLDDLRTEQEPTDAFVLRLLDLRSARVRTLAERVHQLEAQLAAATAPSPPPEYPQAILHAG